MSKNPRKTITWVAAPEPTPRPAGSLGPCPACRVGDHHLCAKVACYRCSPVNHPRHHAAGNTERVLGEPMQRTVRVGGRNVRLRVEVTR